MTPDRSVPFSCPIDGEFSKKGHGTKISVRPNSISMPSDYVRDPIGFKFAVELSLDKLVLKDIASGNF